MSDTYLESQVIEAFKKSKGNETKTRSLIAAQVIEDEQLLRAIVKPHLQGLIAHAVTRAMISISKKKIAKDDLPPLPKASKLNKSQNEFGLDLLKALGDKNVPKFGKEGAAPPVKRKSASEDHVNTLKMLASKSKTKK
jgi:hypothetical protein